MSATEPLALPDGRRLDLRVTGPEDGLPLLSFHGTPGAAVEQAELEAAVHARGGRLVCWSRPGYGGSTRQPGRRVVDVVADADAVLDHLGAQRCVVAGHSGGGPHALACAARLGRAEGALLLASVAPDGVDGLDFLAGMGEENVEELGAARRGEAALREVLEAWAAGMREIRGADVVESMAGLLPPVDREALTGAYAEEVAASFREGLRLGVDGWLDDDLAFVGDWGVAPEDVAVPLALWQGSEDLMVPAAHGRWLAGRMPAAAAHLLDGEGHLSIQLGEARLAELLDPLLGAPAPAAG